MLKSNSKQSAESVLCIPKKKKVRAAAGRIFRKGGFKPGMKWSLMLTLRAIWQWPTNLGLPVVISTFDIQIQ